MKEQFHIVLITVGLFVAGLIAGVWTQRTRPIPPPPAPVLGEFHAFGPPGVSVSAYGQGIAGGGFGIERFSPGHPAAVVTMNGKLAEMQPRIREFQRAVDIIEKEFRGKLDKLLTTEQRTRLASIEAEEAPEALVPGPTPPQPFQIEGPVEEQGIVTAPPSPQGTKSQNFVFGFHTPFPIGGWLMMSMIIYQPSLGHLTSALKLDPSQLAAVKELMIERRTELLALIDKNPPPTLGIGAALP